MIINDIKRWFYALRILGRYPKRLDHLEGQVEVLEGQVEVLEGQVEVLEGQVEVLEGQVEVLEGHTKLFSLNLLNLKNVTVVSRHIKERLINDGIPVNDAEVIYHGVQPEEFGVKASVEIRNGVKLLYVGQIAEHKGIHIIIDALSKIGIHTLEDLSITLTFVGRWGDEKYKKMLDDLIKMKELRKFISFMGSIPRDKVKVIYSEYDILIFSSLWEEPFSIGLLEAMASKIPVIGTATGGSKEIMVDGENCLVYSPENSQELADKITLLIRNEDLRKKLVDNAYDTIGEKFSFKNTVDKIECYLKEHLKTLRSVV